MAVSWSSCIETPIENESKRISESDPQKLAGLLG